MALLLETVLGDIVIDLDIEESPELSRNILKLAKARYYTNTLIYNVTVNRFCQGGDPVGDGSGGACIYGLLDKAVDDVKQSNKRFLKSHGRRLTAEECQEKGRVVATEMNGVPDTVGSQFLITVASGEGRALDGYDVADGESKQTFLSLGRVTKDENNVLDQIAAAYCDANGRPYADIRIVRALVVHDPFEDPEEMDHLLKKRGVILDEANRVIDSPSPERPSEERVPVRIQINEVDMEEDEEDAKKLRIREEEAARKEDRGRAVVLEMLGDLPDADIKAPENVLFICKLNSITMDEDLELILSRFDPNVKVEIIRDHDTGDSLQYAFAEFSTKEQAAEAYFKMNNALVDDRRIKVDFSQSVAKIWDRFNQRMKMPSGGPGGSFGGGGRGPHHGGRGRGGRGGRGQSGGRGRGDVRDDRRFHEHREPWRDHDKSYRDDRDYEGRPRDRDRRYEGDRESDRHHLDSRRHNRYSDDKDHHHNHRRHRHDEDGSYRRRCKDERRRRHRDESHERRRRRHHSNEDSASEDGQRHRRHRKKRKERDRRHHHHSDDENSRDEDRHHRKHRNKSKDGDEDSRERSRRKHKHAHRERDRDGEESRDHQEEERRHRKKHTSPS